MGATTAILTLVHQCCWWSVALSGMATVWCGWRHAARNRQSVRAAMIAGDFRELRRECSAPFDLFGGVSINSGT